MGSPELITMGIDPGSVKTGYGILHRHRDGSFSAVASGVIRTKSGAPLPDRLIKIYEELLQVMEKYQPGAIAIEDVFVKEHPRSALILGHARGVALLAAKHSGAPIFSYAATEVKKSVTGSGRASKDQVARMAMQLLGLSERPAEDAADALCVAMCHAMRKPLVELR
jgi:crossover junction endodeoxyribonuclease RuvC